MLGIVLFNGLFIINCAIGLGLELDAAILFVRNVANYRRNLRSEIQFGNVEMELACCRSPYPVSVGLSTGCCIREPQELQ